MILLENARPPTAEANIRLAVEIARRFAPPGVPLRDTEQFSDACLGLVRAEQDYSGGDFGLFAASCIRNEIVSGYRRRRRQKPTVPLEMEPPAESAVPRPDPAGVLKVLLAVHPDDDDLDRRNRQMLADYFLHGRGMVEIAEEHGITRMAVSLAIRDAIRKIRSRHADFMKTLEWWRDE